MPRVRELITAHSLIADFMMVYLEEAHASDEWPIYQVEIAQHKTLQERLEVARQFQEHFCANSQIKMHVDGMANRFNQELASWPFRFWVLELQGAEPLVGFKAMPKNSSYDLQELDDYLRAHAV